MLKIAAILGSIIMGVGIAMGTEAILDAQASVVNKEPLKYCYMENMSLSGPCRNVEGEARI
jgi:hypothetical protein